MPVPDKQTESREAKPSRSEEARRIIEEYANDLRGGCSTNLGRFGSEF
jgi:hypothetical protein